MNKLKVQTLVIFSFLLIGFHSNTYSQKVSIKQVKLGKLDENIFASCLVGNTIFLCSDKSTNAMRNVIDQNGAKFLSLYSVDIENEKPIGKMMKLSENINKGLNQGPIFIDEKSNKAFYSTNSNENEIIGEKLELFSVDYKLGSFSESVPLKIVGEEFNSAHPLVINEGRQLIFVSDLKGDSSETDLFLCNREGDHWSQPIMIPNINSTKTETFPTYFNNTLYFSSDREDGYGGLDLYQSKYVDGEFQKPEIITEPINSEFDDFFYIIKNGSSGYFSSNRKGVIDRVFYFDYEIPTPLNFKEQTTSFCYLFTDEESEMNDSLIYTWYFGDGNSAEGNTVKYCFDGVGDYTVYCDILDSRNNEDIRKVAEYDVSINVNTPLIQWNKVNEEKTLIVFVEQKYAIDKYKEWYWILNGEVRMTERLELDLDTFDKIDLKLICYDNKNQMPIIGLHKKLR